MPEHSNCPFAKWVQSAFQFISEVFDDVEVRTERGSYVGKNIAMGKKMVHLHNEHLSSFLVLLI